MVDRSRISWPEVKVSLRADGVAFKWAAQEIAGVAGVSVVVGPDVADLPVVADLRDVVLRRAAELIAQQVDRVPVWDGSVLLFQKSTDLERGYTVVMPGGFDAEGVGTFVKDVGGDGVSVQVVGDRLFVAGPKGGVEAVEDLRELLGFGPDAWAVEVRAVELSQSFARELGLAWTVGGKLAVGFGADDVGLLASAPITGAAASALVEVVAKAEARKRDAAVFAQGLLRVVEGGRATMTRGDKVPIPQRRVSDQGNVTITGYTFIETGFTLSVEASRVEDGVLLKLEPEVSSISGYVEEVPIVAQSRVSGSVFVVSGEWVVMSGLEAFRRSDSVSGLPGMLNVPVLRDSSRVDDRSTVLLFVRATRVHASRGGE